MARSRRQREDPSMASEELVRWQPAKPKIGLLRLLVAWALLTAAVYAAAGILPGVELEQTGSGVIVALCLALLNAVVPPLFAALRLPFMVAIGFLLVLAVDALLLLVIADAIP